MWRRASTCQIVVVGAVLLGSAAPVLARDASALQILIAGMPQWRLAVSCAEGTYQVDRHERSAEFCVPLERTSQLRCEIELHGKDIRNKRVQLSYEIRLPETWELMNDWVIISQIMSRPDPGESWRCPLLSTEVLGETLRMYSRSDLQKLTDTSRSTCTPGSIRSRNIFQGLPVARGRWTLVSVEMNLSLSDAGFVTAAVDGKVVGSVSGPTTYNDADAPYLKFGVYKPPPRRSSGTYCVRYRNVHLSFL